MCIMSVSSNSCSHKGDALYLPILTFYALFRAILERKKLLLKQTSSDIV